MQTIAQTMSALTMDKTDQLFIAIKAGVRADLKDVTLIYCRQNRIAPIFYQPPSIAVVLGQSLTNERHYVHNLAITFGKFAMSRKKLKAPLKN